MGEPQFTDQKVRDPRLVALRDKVKITPDPNPSPSRAKIKVITKEAEFRKNSWRRWTCPKIGRG